jgi:hypothetical protein
MNNFKENFNEWKDIILAKAYHDRVDFALFIKDPEQWEYKIIGKELGKMSEENCCNVECACASTEPTAEDHMENFKIMDCHNVSQAYNIQSKVYKPSHYTKYKIEPITFIMANGFNFWQGSIIKYVARAGLKQYDGMTLEESEITDLEKVRRYAEMRINQIKGKEIL